MEVIEAGERLRGRTGSISVSSLLLNGNKDSLTILSFCK